MAKDQGGFKKKTADEIRDDIRNRAEHIDQEYLHLGKDLYVAKHCEHYLKWGFSTWRDYIGSEPGLSIKRDERLRKVWKTLVKGLGLTPKDLHSIGFSKASLLSRDGLLARDNYHEWLSKARKLSFRDLEAVVKKHGKPLTFHTEERDETDEEGKKTGKKVKVKVATTDDGTDFELTSFSLSEEQRDLVEEAIGKAELLAESAKRGHLLTLICTDFLAGNLGSDPKERTRLKFHLRNLEEAFGVKVMALPEGDEATTAISEFVNSRPDLFAPAWDGPEEDDDESEVEEEGSEAAA
jgi:hypothetical protein